ncbi:MAG: ATP phosphoribosyltransferase regulatory subunit [Pseudomonadota bacterium]
MNTSSSSRPWQLPDGIDELLPGDAQRVETLRRSLLDCAELWGYQLVIPPMIEFTDSLLVGVGEDLDLLTFKVPDQLSGRMLGFRADITPQVARMDAHSIGSDAPTRLCYAGTILHTRTESLASSRSPLQLGAELFGATGLEADVEVIELMLTMMDAAGLNLDSRLTLDLGHADIFKHLVAAAGIKGTTLEAELFDALQRKSKPDLESLIRQLPSDARANFAKLLSLQGDESVLDEARTSFDGIAPALDLALKQLGEVIAVIRRRFPGLAVYLDLAELRGYRYHTGIVFALYSQSLGEALARGGRYDNVGADYGRERAATGFAMDLRLMAALVQSHAQLNNAIAAPRVDDPKLRETVNKLRRQQQIVIVTLGDEPDARCDRELALIDGNWTVQARTSASTEGDS